MTKFRMVLSAAFLLSALAGCSDGKGESCTTDDACGSALICGQVVFCGGSECAGICAETCTVSEDCGDQGSCMDEPGTDRKYCTVSTDRPVD